MFVTYAVYYTSCVGTCMVPLSIWFQINISDASLVIAIRTYANQNCLTAAMWAWCVLWHIDLFLDNDRETNNETTATAKQQLSKYATVLEPLLGSGPRATVEVLLEAVFTMNPLRGYVTRPTEWVQCNWMQWSEVNLLVSEWVRGLLRFGPCELLLLQAGSCGTAPLWTRRKENVRRWKLLPGNDWWTQNRLRRLNTRCSYL
jgi:hypothetical protein